MLAERAPLAEDHRTVDGLSRLAEGKSGDNRLRMSLSGYVLAGAPRAGGGQRQRAAVPDVLRALPAGAHRRRRRPAGPAAGCTCGSSTPGPAWSATRRPCPAARPSRPRWRSRSGWPTSSPREAGGTLLETLFVDEGFGSLDDDTLDEVMGVLDGLRDGGRTVGIVSHVADLRQRIPVQLRVEKGRAGSHVLQ